ncbi:MAG: molybdopterin-dependent oxidoreductase, partial [bacterium]
MAKVTIDGKSIEVDNSCTILDCARELGVYIPTLCYDPALTPFGACRICMVEMEPGNRLVAACHTKVMDNMVIHANNDRVKRARKLNMELVLARHPLDCLICERGGECHLQTVCFNIGLAAGDKKALENRLVDVFQPEPMHIKQDDTRSLIERDINKCILCRKCVRTCKEVAGVGAISYSNRGFYADVCTFYGRRLDCEFCGQCIERCPVGALFPKKSKYQSRVWQTGNVETVCNFCGCGCKLILRCKDNVLVKVRTDLEKEPNKGRLCVRGHFGFDFVNHPDRIRKPMIKKDGKFDEVSWEEAFDYTAKKLKQLKKKFGGKALAGIGSVGVTNEDNYLFQKMFRMALGSNNLDNYVRYEHAPTQAAMLESLGYPGMTNPMADLHSSDLIVVIGADLTSTTPVLGMEVKQAAMAGTDLIVIDPRKTKLVRFASQYLAVRPGSDIALLNAVMQEIIKNNLTDQEFINSNTEGYQGLANSLKGASSASIIKETGISLEAVQQTAGRIGKAQKAAFVFGTGVTQHAYGTDLVHAVINLALLTGNIGKKGA